MTVTGLSHKIPDSPAIGKRKLCDRIGPGRINGAVTILHRDIPGADRDMLGFATLTLCPIERTLIVPELLTAQERDWLNAYHARVAEVLALELEGADRDWLLEKCAAI